MTKRSIDLHDELLALAQRELSTTGVSDTVRAASRQAANGATPGPAGDMAPQGGLEALAYPGTEPTCDGDRPVARRHECGGPVAAGRRRRAVGTATRDPAEVLEFEHRWVLSASGSARLRYRLLAAALHHPRLR